MSQTTFTRADIITAGREVSLTAAVVNEWAGRGTPKQREYLYGFLDAERSSRQAARRARLLSAAHLPAMKSLEGYDWGSVGFPAGYTREQLTGLDFLEGGGDLVFYGDVGTGKTHLACALAARCCEAGMAARFHTAASLVAGLRRAKDKGRLDREFTALARNRLLVIDELGYLPIDIEGARLLFQVISDAYERRSLILTTNLEFATWGTVFADDQMAPRSSIGSSTTAGSSISVASPTG